MVDREQYNPKLALLKRNSWLAEERAATCREGWGQLWVLGFSEERTRREDLGFELESSGTGQPEFQCLEGMNATGLMSRSAW